MSARPGPLFVIGGHEDKEGGRKILGAIAAELGEGTLVVATIASAKRDGYFEAYCKGFAPLGVGRLVELYLDDRDQAGDPARARMIDQAGGIFFTGGDQSRLMTLIKDTPIDTAVRALHERGGLVAGTSAGASAQGETMLVGGGGEETPRIGDIKLAPGLGLIPDSIIDQHFAERGRIGRLVGAVAHCPRCLGIGIDEDTALRIEAGTARVIGSGGVTIVDASRAIHSNAAGATPAATVSLHGATLHALGEGDRFDLTARIPGAD
ncbi:cyanophycinase [Sphingopyxis sp. JAI128]|uniref:cyanophycinase n=1 Tax=Sphingopyxis sp. JAI128 TaxID=2723066 RepID=UPI0016179B63|nr:cyanophycinase [Sphingopyxis sp. JAI128]MBB6425373.1 cyanophycinase [Sphingopyxis sp. JAI128]